MPDMFLLAQGGLSNGTPGHIDLDAKHERNTHRFGVSCMGTTRIIWRSPALRRQVRHVVCTAGVGSRDLAARFVTSLGAARGNRRVCWRCVVGYRRDATSPMAQCPRGSGFFVDCDTGPVRLAVSPIGPHEIARTKGCCPACSRACLTLRKTP